MTFSLDYNFLIILLSPVVLQRKSGFEMSILWTDFPVAVLLSYIQVFLYLHQTYKYNLNEFYICEPM